MSPGKRAPPYLDSMYHTTPALYLLGQDRPYPCFLPQFFPPPPLLLPSCSENVLGQVLILSGYLRAGFILCS